MIEALRQNERDCKRQFAVKKQVSEHLYKWSDDKMPDKYEWNNYDYEEGVTLAEIEDARDRELDRGESFIRFVGHAPCDLFHGFEADHVMTMVLEGEPDWEINDRLVFRKPALSELIEMELKHYGKQYGEDFAVRNITRNQEKLDYIGAYLAGKLVGSCYLFTTGSCSVVDGLLVDEDYRHQKVGTSLLYECYRRAGETFFLHADAEDTPRQMYEKMGFVVRDHTYAYFEKFQPVQKPGDRKKVQNVTVLSLSRGLIGDKENEHQLKLGTRRLQELGLNVSFGPNALKGSEFLKAHPEARARDLTDAMIDGGVDMILCAIGGDDTYRLLPYLFENDELKKVLRQKIFLGFSDSTVNHLMLYQCGLNTFYGQSFLCDLCEQEPEMLPYSKRYFEELIRTGTISEIRPSEVWYEERTDFSEAATGTLRIRHEDRKGFELLQGTPRFQGKILGGCLESLYGLLDGFYYEDEPLLAEKYGVFPSLDDWKGKILLLETCEEMPEPDRYRKELEKLKEIGIFRMINGILCGKPMDETYYEEYKKILIEVADDPELPIVFNINVGHATPRCIIPFGIDAIVDTEEQVIRF